MKVLTGKVISKKMQKTATVAVERTIKHPIYKKRFTRVKKYHVHDDFDTPLGSIVGFVASRPYSKLVKWQIIKDVGSKKVDQKNKKIIRVKQIRVKTGRNGK